jgi:hypothetical protein
MSLVCAAAAAVVVAVGGTAEAHASCPTATITSGTGTIFMSKAYINRMAAGNIAITAQTPISVTDQGTYTTTIWNTRGGDADLKACTGTVQLAAGSLVTNTVTGASLLLDDIRLDVATDSIHYTLATPGGDVTIEGLHLAGVQKGYVHGGYVTYSASELLMEPVAAQNLNSTLGTTAFTPTEVFGAFSTTFKLSRPNSPSGPVSCG